MISHPTPNTIRTDYVITNQPASPSHRPELCPGCDSTNRFLHTMISTIQVGQQWWKTWRESSVNTQIFAAMVTVGGLTVLVKLVAGVKELVVAYQFGTSDALDAFLIAFLLPGFAIGLV